MSHAALFNIPTPQGLAERYVNKLLPVTVGPAGVLPVPHLLSISAGNIPITPVCNIVVNVHLKTNAHAFNPIEVTAVDDVAVTLTNADAVNPMDVEIWVALLPPWLGLDGTGGLIPNNWYTNGGLGYAPGAGAFGPAGLSDQNPPAAPWDVPALAGHVNSGVAVNVGDWIRYDDPIINALGFTNDGAGGQDVEAMGATCHSVQRVWGGLSTLLSVVGPIGPINGGGQAVVPHGLEVLGLPVLPDLAWTVPVGGNGVGVALVGSNYQTLALADAVACTWDNENAPGGFNTYYAMFYRQWSGGRVQ